jgi:mRNA interferase HigB
LETEPISQKISQYAIPLLDLSQFAIILAERQSICGCNVRVISVKRLREFWKSRKSDSEAAERDLKAWYKLARHAKWDDFGQMKRHTFGSADQVGNCVVFDAGNNRYRIISRINYEHGTLFVLKVMDHKEYDKKQWIESCGCRRPPPIRAAKARKPIR